MLPDKSVFKQTVKNILFRKEYVKINKFIKNLIVEKYFINCVVKKYIFNFLEKFKYFVNINIIMSNINTPRTMRS